MQGKIASFGVLVRAEKTVQESVLLRELASVRSERDSWRESCIASQKSFIELEILSMQRLHAAKEKNQVLELELEESRDDVQDYEARKVELSRKLSLCQGRSKSAEEALRKERAKNKRLQLKLRQSKDDLKRVSKELERFRNQERELRKLRELLQTASKQKPLFDRIHRLSMASSS